MKYGQFQPGDIVACYARDRVSRLISWATLSPLAPTRRLIVSPSHVAIICESPQDGLLWVESTTFCPRPCVLRGLHAAGAQAHRPEERVCDYTDQGGRCDIYRLSETDSLSTEESGLLSRLLLDRFVARGIAYDMGGALISGTRILKFSRLLQRLFPQYLDGNQVFCSELIAACLQRVCRMNRDNPTKYNPGRLVRTLVREGTYQFAGEAVPLMCFPGDSQTQRKAA